MKRVLMISGLFLLGLAFVFLAAGCKGTQTENTPTPEQGEKRLNKRSDRIAIDVSPQAAFDGYFAVEKEAVVHIIARGFPPRIYLHALLQSGTAGKTRAAATSQLDEDGKGSLVFFFPGKWDDGAAIENGEVELVMIWNDHRDRIIIPLKVISD